MNLQDCVPSFFLLLCVLLWSTSAQRSRYESSRRINRRKNKSEKPNIVVIMTDDQDVLLGSMQVMPKTLRIMRDQGLEFKNSFVSSPMCCPSRSSFLTGLYPHNHHVYTNHDNCSSTYWQQNHEVRSFATYLNNAGYRTGYFGKYLNEYNGSHIPPGWREWVGLVRNSRFYNYTVNFNGNKMQHGDNYYADYFTDLIANDSVTFLKQSKEYFKRRPVLMVLSTPAPHGPEDSAPQYQHLFFNNTLHRTPTWNMAPNLDKQYLLRITQKMEPIHQKFTDVLQQKRLQTLQSVDDLVEKVYNELWMLGELDNTYIIYTSDHGYHLGQFGIAKGKGFPYDFDTRVPLYIRGPGIRPRTRIANMALNVDLAPTILDMAGVAIPDHMDGRSLLKLIKKYENSEDIDEKEFVKTRKPWRDTILLERGKITKNKQRLLMREQNKIFLDNLNNMENIPDHLLQYATAKQRRIFRHCAKPENKPPCKPGQKYQCVTEEGRKLPRLLKCRPGDLTIQSDDPLGEGFGRKGCPCANKRNLLNKKERRNQRLFLQKHVNKAFKPKFLRFNRTKRSYLDMEADNLELQSQELPSVELFEPRCRELPNKTLLCDKELYQNAEAWKDHKGQLDEMIQEYRKMLEDLRKYRRHLKTAKPKESYLSQFDDGDSGPGYVTNYDDSDSCDCDSPREKLRQERRKMRKERRRKKKNKRRRRKNSECNKPDMNCTPHDNTHWKTPPLWDYGPFCYCTNSNNNTFWCLRTINSTHDLLYCEFINNFISYYDLLKDPFQFKNAIHDVNYGVLQQLHDQLNEMRACVGNKDCNKAGTLKDSRNLRSSLDDDDEEEEDPDEFGFYRQNREGDNT